MIHFSNRKESVHKVTRQGNSNDQNHHSNQIQSITRWNLKLAKCKHRAGHSAHHKLLIDESGKVFAVTPDDVVRVLVLIGLEHQHQDVTNGTVGINCFALDLVTPV